MFERDPTTATIGVEILPFEVGYLPEFFQKKGEMEIHYTESIREKTLREFKEAIAGEGSMNGASFTDECLLLFLTSKKYDITKALAKLKNCMNFRRKNDIMFKVPSFDVLSVFMTTEFLTVLPWRCQDGCTLLLITLDKYNSVQHSLEAIKQVFAYVIYQCLRDPMTQVNGLKVILDFNMPIDILKICSPQNVYVLYYGTQVLLPGRYKKIHIVNMGAPGRVAWQIIRVFMSKKVKERVQIHATCDTLLDFFPRAVLPTKYGGDLKDYDMTEWLRKVSSPEELNWLSSIFYSEKPDAEK